MKPILLLGLFSFLWSPVIYGLCPRALDYKKYESASLDNTLLKKASEYYGICLDQLEQLAKDPAHNGKMTHGSKLEAILAKDLSSSMFKNCNLKRGMGTIEFEDCHGIPWDIKKPVLVEDRPFNPRQVADSFKRKLNRKYEGKDIHILFDASFIDVDSYQRVMNILKVELEPKQFQRVNLVCLKEDILHPLSTFSGTTSVETTQTPNCP